MLTSAFLITSTITGSALGTLKGCSPVRSVFEAAGAAVDYDAVARAAEIDYNNSRIIAPIGSGTVSVGGIEVALSGLSKIENGYTMLPVDFINSIITEKDKASAVLNSLESDNMDIIATFVSENGYIQHNLEFADGRQAMLDALPILKATGSTVEIQRVFQDGDYVFLHTKYNLFGNNPQAGFDIFRFKMVSS